MEPWSLESLKRETFDIAQHCRCANDLDYIGEIYGWGDPTGGTKCKVVFKYRYALKASPVEILEPEIGTTTRNYFQEYEVRFKSRWGVWFGLQKRVNICRSSFSKELPEVWKLIVENEERGSEHYLGITPNCLPDLNQGNWGLDDMRNPKIIDF